MTVLFWALLRKERWEKGGENHGKGNPEHTHYYYKLKLSNIFKNKVEVYTISCNACALSNSALDEMAEFTSHTDLFNFCTCLHDLKLKSKNAKHDKQNWMKIEKKTDGNKQYALPSW